jgi:SagB-type dehydrogenase family enzyme
VSKKNTALLEHCHVLRRSRCLIGYWEKDEFILENYLTQRRSAISVAVLGILDALEVYTPINQILDRLSTVSGHAAFLERLVEADLLVSEHSELDQRETNLNRWMWGPEARWYHYRRRAVQFEDTDRERISLTALVANDPPPAPWWEPSGDTLPLPKSPELPHGEIWDVLKRRRTKRDYSQDPLPLDLFSAVLQWTWGASEIRADPILGPYLLKTSPSAGARHPTDVYTCALSIEGLASGIYRYVPTEHSLAPIRYGQFNDLMVKLCADQGWVRDAAAIFFMIAVLERSMWKYRHSHAYAVLYLDAGHLGQTFHLVCTALGLAPFTTAAMQADKIEGTLGLDGVREVVLYAAATGWPKRSTPF